jgi:hypothetical protein
MFHISYFLAYPLRVITVHHYNTLCEEQTINMANMPFSTILNALVGFEVSKAVTINNVVFWDIKTQLLLHRKYITSPLQSPAG